MSKFTEKILKGIPRGLTSQYLKQQKAPQARWLSPETIEASKRMAYDPASPGGKILIGAIGPKLIGIEDNRHILSVAGSRAGKSVTVIGNLLFYKGSVLATDPKAELANITAARRAALGQKVFVLDPFGQANKSAAPYRARFNPMASLKADNPTIIEDAGLIADGLVIAAGRDPHWDESARNFIEGVILHVATALEHKGERNLVTVRALITKALTIEVDEEDGEEYFPLRDAMLANSARLSTFPRFAAVGGCHRRIDARILRQR